MGNSEGMPPITCGLDKTCTMREKIRTDDKIAIRMKYGEDDNGDDTPTLATHTLPRLLFEMSTSVQIKEWTVEVTPTSPTSVTYELDLGYGNVNDHTKKLTINTSANVYQVWTPLSKTLWNQTFKEVTEIICEMNRIIVINPENKRVKFGTNGSWIQESDRFKFEPEADVGYMIIK